MLTHNHDNRTCLFANLTVKRYQTAFGDNNLIKTFEEAKLKYQQTTTHPPGFVMQFIKNKYAITCVQPE